MAICSLYGSLSHPVELTNKFDISGIKYRSRTGRSFASRASGSLQESEKAATGPTFLAGGKKWLLNEVQRLKTMERHPGDGLVLTRGAWDWTVRKDGLYVLQGRMQFHNITTHHELFVPELSASVTLLSSDSIASIATSIKVVPEHPGCYPAARPDGYWTAYIIRAGESTTIKVVVEIKGDAGALRKVKAARVQVHYVSYGPHGQSPHVQHVILPLQFPDFPSDSAWMQVNESLQVLPIKTHLLCHQDDPVFVIKMYVKKHVRTGDVVAIAETPLAVMQVILVAALASSMSLFGGAPLFTFVLHRISLRKDGRVGDFACSASDPPVSDSSSKAGRFRHPGNVRPSRMAKMICLLFHPTSSLATACGMQSLIDLVGKARVLLAVVMGIVFRMIGVRGMFYRVAGMQARLIDDVTGTLPPYDQFITLGPIDLEKTCEDLKAEIGCDIAIVDVNDLKKVDIIGASEGTDHGIVTMALINNPAGNSDQQTPLLIIRPDKK